MKKPLQEILNASKKVLETKREKIIFIYLTLFFFLLFAFLPAFLIPGNSLGFQLSVLRMQDILTFIPLSLASALMLQMQFHLFIKTKTMKSRAGALSGGGIGASSAVFGGLLATAACSSCVAGLLGFLGAGSVFFIVRNNLWFVAGALILMTGSLYLASKKVNGHCATCEVKPSDHVEQNSK